MDGLLAGWLAGWMGGCVDGWMDGPAYNLVQYIMLF